MCQKRVEDVFCGSSCPGDQAISNNQQLGTSSWTRAGQGHATNYTPTASNLLLSSDAEYDHNNNYNCRKNLQLAVTSKISFPNGGVHIKWLYYSIPSPWWQRQQAGQLVSLSPISL